MSWRAARSLITLFEQANEAWPRRSRASDGTIGDADHQNRSSDHNPWCGPGVVTALDLTHDPRNGCDCFEIVEALIDSRDERIKYIIWDSQIWRSYKTSSSHPAPWTPQPYYGPNPHTRHMHLSVHCNASKDSTRKWKITSDEEDLDMTKAELRKIVREVVNNQVPKIVRQEMDKQRKLLAVGKDRAYKPENVNLRKAIDS